MRNRVGVTMLATLMLVAYLGLWPVPIDAVSWKAPVGTGNVQVNNALQGRHLISLGAEVGPEHVILGPDGQLYVSVASGNILRMNQDGSGQQVFARTGGRPLGLAFDGQGNLIAADAVRGLLSIAADGKVTVLANTVDGDAIRFANAVVVARDGKIYLSDSSTRFSPADWGGTVEAALLDVLEQSSTGRVIEYDPVVNACRIVATGFSLATACCSARTSTTCTSPRAANTGCGRFRQGRTNWTSRRRRAQPMSCSTTCPAIRTTSRGDKTEKSGWAWRASATHLTRWRNDPSCASWCCASHARYGRCPSPSAM
jgi:hypothetical protein